MVLTPSAMNPLGSKMPPFKLPDPDGKLFDSASLHAQPVLIAFICNHCPYVKHMADALAELGREALQKGIQVVAINSNDWTTYSEDSPRMMAEEIIMRGYPFPYLADETQEVARAFDARCTPDFFLYDRDHRLVYRGQFDSTRPGKGTATGSDLRNACTALLNGQPISEEQIPSVGCNIKWRAGMAPDAT